MPEKLRYSLNDNGNTSNVKVLPRNDAAISLLKSFEDEPLMKI
jgi:hypothetical protein